MTTLRELVNAGMKKLAASEIEDAGLDSFLLLQHITGLSRADYYLHCDDREYTGSSELFENIERHFNQLIEKRYNHVPLAYIVGSQDFMGLNFLVNDDVLIPEQDTETLVEEVMKVSSGKFVLDMCTGSGCIAVAIARLGMPSYVAAGDISTKALCVAQRNAERLKADVTFYESDLFQNIPGKYDIIVSNPPYIQSEVIDMLAPEVKNHEPRLALDGEADGLSFYRRISAKAADYLNSRGRIYYEIGYDEGRQVSEILADNGFQDIDVIRDLSGLDRVVTGRVADLEENHV